jgi:rubrerythrin
MGYPYGRITGTKGADGEPKVMLGFPTKTEAKKGFLKHYDDPKFLGPVSTVPVEKLKEMVDTGKAMKKISFALGLSKFALLATSPVDVQGVPPKDVNKEILRQSVIAELDASNVYEQMAAKTDDGKIKKILLDVSKEEKTHAGEFQALLHDTDPEQAAEQEAGAQEVCAKTSAVAHTSMLDELVKLNAISALQFEAAKLGPHEKKPIPKAVAQHSLERLRRLEESKASIGEIGRAAGVGALVSPVASLAYRLAAGPKAIGHLGVWRGPRDLLASSVHGSVIGGLVPAGRHKLEREVEKQKLREYVGTHPRGTLRGKIRSTVGV